MDNKKTIADLRTKYSGELARMEERQKSLEGKRCELMEKLGLKSIEGLDIDSEIAKAESELNAKMESLNGKIDEYEKLKVAE